MKLKKIFSKFIYILAGLIFFGLASPCFCSAMTPGTILYRTSREGKMFGYSQDPLIYSDKGIIKNIYPGHVGIYVGKENGVDYVVEALASGVVKTPASQFINATDGEKFLGAKLPRQLSPLQRSKAVAIAKSLAARGLAYDVDFKSQKGPDSGQWTCVGLVEKIYESADISNPNNLAALEYNPNYYAVDITPDGFDNQSIFNSDGDCASRSLEFSKISRRVNTILPLPELIGFNAGLEYKGERYIFLPYTQFLQSSLQDVVPDIPISSEFSSDLERGSPHSIALVLRWSLVNNPESSLNRVVGFVTKIAQQTVNKTIELAKNIGEFILGSNSETQISLNDLEANTKAAINAKTTAAKTTAAKKTSSTATNEKVINNVPPVKININTKATSPAGNTSSALTSSQSASSKSGIISSTAKTNSKTIISASAKASSSAVSQLKSASQLKATSSQAVSPVNSESSANSHSSSGSNTNSKILSPILINRIYSTGDNDWIQLYNPTGSDYDLAANEYRLEKAKTAQDPSLMVRIGNSADGACPGGTIIPAHGYYLLVSSKANNYYRAQAEAIIIRDEFSWPSSGYTIYLGAEAISSYNDSDIIDAVGFGVDATYFQGTGPASAITDNYILGRRTNSRDNASDFSLIPSDDPALIDFFNPLNSGATSTDQTATTTNQTSTTTNQTSTTTNQTSTTTNQTATTTESLATSTSSSATSSEENLDDNLSGENSENIALISKIYSTSDNDWVELFNPTDSDFDLAAAGFRLERAKTALDPSLIMRFGNLDDGVYPGGTVIPAGGHYLVVRDEASQYYLNQADAISSRDDFSWTGSGYSLYLGRGSISSSTDPDIVDLVGFGSDALYWQGSAPAPTITDYNILHRWATTGQNNSDFELIPSDDPSTPPDSNSTSSPANFTNPFFASLPDLYVPPVPINSSGLTDLWNFDECYGSGRYAVGKWGCAREVGYNYQNMSASLKDPVDLNNLSVSFYYQATMVSPRVTVRLSNLDGNFAQLSIMSGFITVEGLPTDNIYFWRSDIPFDNNWHQATLVVNQSEDYWAVYIDGEEKVFKSFFNRLNPLTNIEVSGNQGSFLIDELAVWNRSLLPSEIAENYQLARPFFSTFERVAQQPAVLKNFWRFEEDAGSIAVDEMSSTTLNAYPDLWTGRSHDNYALSVASGKNLTADLLEPVVAQDLSLTFWWKNISYPSGGRANILLTDSADNSNLFSFQADYFSQPHWLNNNYGVFSAALPNDDLWHHFAVVYDSYRYKLTLYFDGEKNTSQSFIRFLDSQEINRLIISTNSYNSAIDDLAIWEGALSEAEINNIFSNTR